MENGAGPSAAEPVVELPHSPVGVGEEGLAVDCTGDVVFFSRRDRHGRHAVEVAQEFIRLVLPLVLGQELLEGLGPHREVPVFLRQCHTADGEHPAAEGTHQRSTRLDRARALHLLALLDLDQLVAEILLHVLIGPGLIDGQLCGREA